MDWSFNVRLETIKILVENIYWTVFDVIWNKSLLDLLPKEKQIKENQIGPESESHSVVSNSLQPHGL